MKTSKVFAIVLAMLAIVGISAAALVYYESNTVETTTQVESPIVLSLDEGLPTTFYAGSCDTITVSGEYKANRPIRTIPLVVIGCDDPNVEMHPMEVATCGDSEDAFGEGGSYRGYISFHWANSNYTGTLELKKCGNCLYATYDDGVWCDPENPTATATIDLMLHPEIVPAGYWVKVVCISPDDPELGHYALSEALEDLTGCACLSPEPTP